MDKRFITTHSATFTHQSAVTQSCSDTESRAVMAKKAWIQNERQKVAKVTSHDFWRKKDGIAQIIREMAVIGRQTCKSEKATALLDRSMAGEAT